MLTPTSRLSHPSTESGCKSGGFPKVRDTFFGVPIVRIRIIVSCGYIGVPIVGNIQICVYVSIRLP